MSKYLRGFSISIILVLTLVLVVSSFNSRLVSMVDAKNVLPKRIERVKDQNKVRKTELQGDLNVKQNTYSINNIPPNIHDRKIDTVNSNGLGLVMGLDGLPRLVYISYDDNKVYHSRCTDKDCLNPVITEVASSSYGTSPGSYISTLGQDGYVRFVYEDGNGVLQFVRCKDQDCITKTTTPVDENTINYPGFYGMQVIMGNDHLPRIVYANCSDHPTDNYDVHFVRFSGEDNPNINTNLTALGVNINCYSYSEVNMAIGPDGFPRIIYIDGNTKSLKMARCTNVNCSTIVIAALDSTNSARPGYYGTVIRFGSNGFPLIAYMDWDGLVFYMKCEDIVCSSRTITSLPRALGDSTNGIGMDLRNGDLASISYPLTENTFDILTCLNVSCSNYSQQNINNSMQYGSDGGSSLVIGADNMPRILYSDSTVGTFFTRIADVTEPILSVNSFNTHILTSNLTFIGNIVDSEGFIKNVEYQLDSKVGSWALCTSDDGTFNEPNEDFTCSLSGITDGTHKIYVRGSDISDNVIPDANYTVIDIFKSSNTDTSNLDTTPPNKVLITNIGGISNVPNKDLLKYYFTSQTPTIKGTSEANSTVYFVTNGHTYSTTTGNDSKYSINLNNPSLIRGINTIKYYAKDSSLNKSEERTLVLTVGEENFPVRSSSSSSSSTSSLTSSSSSSSSSSSISSTTSSSSTSSKTSSKTELEDKEITVKDEKGNILPNTKVTINGKTYTTDSKGKVTVKGEVKGEYIVEYEKDGVKYSSTIKPNENIVTLKKADQPNYILPIIVIIILLVLGSTILFVILKKRNKSGESTTF